MYAALWRVLPGPWFVKLLIVLVLVAAIVYGLFYYVFPWVNTIVNPGEVTVTTQ